MYSALTVGGQDVINIKEYEINIQTKENCSAVIKIKTKTSESVFEVENINTGITFDTETVCEYKGLPAYQQKKINLSVDGLLKSTVITV